jgi:hypothetical protein
LTSARPRSILRYAMAVGGRQLGYGRRRRFGLSLAIAVAVLGMSALGSAAATDPPTSAAEEKASHTVDDLRDDLTEPDAGDEATDAAPTPRDETTTRDEETPADAFEDTTAAAADEVRRAEDRHRRGA